MSFQSTLPIYLWGLLGLIPIGIILLYFLKLRRQPMRVPSTYLWARTIEDLHVNSLLQRLRQNVLLLLQLLLIAAVAFALLRPGWRDSAAGGRRMIFLLDNSASMRATDVEPSRFEEAKRRIRGQIENMAGDDVAMLIAFSDRADVRQGYTSDTRRLLESLDLITVTEQPTDLGEALRAAAGLANPGRTSQAGDTNDIQVADALPADLFIYSDGGFAPVVDFSLGNLRPEYRRIGKDVVDNLAVLTLAAQRNPEKAEQVQALARVKNFGSQQAKGTVSLMRGDQLLDASEVDLAPDEEASLTFDLDALDATELKMVIDRADNLAVDNEAYAVFSPPRQANVLLVTSGNRPLTLGMATEQSKRLAKLETVSPAYLKDPAYEQRTLANEFDLIIYDRCAPTMMPPTNTWFIDAQPPSEGWKFSESKGRLFVADVDRVHPLMRYLELFDLLIYEGKTMELPRGGRTLLSSDAGPLMAIAPREGFQDLVLSMPIMALDKDGDVAYNTDWPVQRSWPVMILNVLQGLAGAEDMTAGASVSTGATVSLHPGPQINEIVVELPDGGKRKMSVGSGGVVPFADTYKAGVYRIYDGERLLQTFAVNMFSPRESDLKPAEAVELGYKEVAQSTAGEAPTRRELWRWLLLAAIGLLACEWLVYTRRVGI